MLPARIVLLWTFVFLSAALARAENLILCGGSAKGLSSLITSGLNSALDAAGSGIAITYQVSGGGYANIVQMAKGNCQLGTGAVGEALQAFRGESPFEAPVSGFSALMVTNDDLPMQWVMTAAFADKYAIASLDDIATAKPPLRLIVNRPGLLPTRTAEFSLQKVGVELADIEKWGGKVEFLSSGDAAGIMQAGDADMWVNATLVGSSAIEQIANSVPVTMLQVPEAVREAVVTEFGDRPSVIAAGSYPWQKDEVKTHSTRSIVLVTDDVDEDLIYRMTKAILENLYKVHAVHPAMKALTPQMMHSLENFPYHPGAIRAYAEAGLN